VRRLGRKLGEGRLLVAGTLSGTSGDGIDVVVTELDVEGELHGGRVVAVRGRVFETLPFPCELAPRVRGALDGEALGPAEIAQLGRDLGTAFGRAARRVAEAAGLELDLLGSHGLTVFHHDGAPPGDRASLQLGEGDHAAEAAGCPVVSDFRQADLAAGGEGAPVSVLADDLVFAEAPRPAAILNLGGIANLSWLPAGGEPLAFDSGPANCLLDGLARERLGADCDRDGRAAARGRARPELLAAWLDHPFFCAPHPKSTGRDTFGPGWLRRLLAGAGGEVATEDLLATAVELVAETVSRAVAALPEAPRVLWVAGGGVHNPALMGALARRVGCELRSAAEAGVDPDAREALVFAVLAGRCVLGEPVTRQAATGARPGRVLGKISPGPR